MPSPTPSPPTHQTLATAICVPCEGDVEKLTQEQSTALIDLTPDWVLDDGSNRIRRQLNCKTFVAAVQIINTIAEIAETQQHHPDLLLTGYRHLEIVLTTHAIGGLSENDFIMAAHIDTVLLSSRD